MEDAQELKLEDIEVDLPELKDDKAEAAPGQAAAAVGDFPQEVAGSDEKSERRRQARSLLKDWKNCSRTKNNYQPAMKELKEKILNEGVWLHRHRE